MGFSKLFWGFIFLFDLNINNFDILPDALGYVLIYLGLRQLTDLDINFQIAKKIAFLLIFLSIFDILISLYLLNDLLLTTSMAIFNLVYLIIGLIMVYRVFFGIQESSKRSNNFNLETKAIYTWKLFLAFNVLLIINAIIPFDILSWFISISSVFIYLLILFLLREAKSKITLPNKSRVYTTP